MDQGFGAIMEITMAIYPSHGFAGGIGLDMIASPSARVGRSGRKRGESAVKFRLVDHHYYFEAVFGLPTLIAKPSRRRLRSLTRICRPLMTWVPMTTRRLRGHCHPVRKISGAVSEGCDSLISFIPFAYVEAAANLLTNPKLDPFGKIPEFKFCAAKVEAIDPATRVAAE
jgi:hypothetical protein